MVFDPPTTPPPGLYRWTGTDGAASYFYLDDAAEWWVLRLDWERIGKDLDDAQFLTGELRFVGLPP